MEKVRNYILEAWEGADEVDGKKVLLWEKGETGYSWKEEKELIESLGFKEVEDVESVLKTLGIFEEGFELVAYTK